MTAPAQTAAPPTSAPPSRAPTADEHHVGSRRGRTRRRTASTNGLGLASLALGVPLLARPAQALALMGLADKADRRQLATLVGGRELAAAAALLARPSRFWLWSRVAGDVMDLALLRSALNGNRRDQPARTRATMGVAAGIGLADLVAAVSYRAAHSPLVLTATTTVQASPQQAYAFSRRFEQLPRFMEHLEQVSVDGRRSRWTAAAPLGKHVSWDAETTTDVPGERIAWRSVGRGPVRTEGEVRFVTAPGDRGTEVHVAMRYDLPAGRLGQAFARFFGQDPHQQLDDDLRRFKQVMETGEVMRSDGAPWGKRARHEFPQRPAQPMSDRERRKLGIPDVTEAALSGDTPFSSKEGQR
ncbi:MAG: SRPBCC family protein [Motilibacteraceae bacterium]